MNENITPLPCPFCGSAVQVEIEPCQFGGFEYQHEGIVCECGASMETDNQTTIAKWNRRTDPALTDRVKELEEALGDCVGMLRGFTSSEHDEEGAVTQQIKDADAALNKEPTT